LAQLGGALSQRYDRWRDLLIQSLAMLEAAVDFPDEDLPEAVAERARPGLRRLERRDSTRPGRCFPWTPGARRLLHRLDRCAERREEQLLNGLVEREAAIVTEIAWHYPRRHRGSAGARRL
jgi:tRNA modification GTPase